MSTVNRREVTTVRVEFQIPANHPYGACWNQVELAIKAAWRELREEARIAEEAEPPDDMIRVLPMDDAIVVYYDKPARVIGEAGATP